MIWKYDSKRRPRSTVFSSLSIYERDGGALLDGAAVAFEFSQGGLKIESKMTLRVGQEYYLVISLPRGGAFPIYGRVAWSEHGVNTHLAGIVLTRVSLFNRLRLYALRRDYAVDWGRLASVIMISVAILIITAAVKRLFSSYPTELRFLIRFVPTIVSVALAFWAGVRLMDRT